MNTHFEAGYQHVAPAGLELTILMPQNAQGLGLDT